LQMRSLDQFGISLNWEFRFFNKEDSLSPLPNQILVDLGNRLDFGVIDTHQGDTPFDSLARAVVKNSHFVTSHLLGKLNEEYASGRPPQVKELTFSFCTHRVPDWGSMGALYICNQLVKTGRVPRDINWLLDASDAIAQAKAKIKGQPNRPFIIYYLITSLATSDEEKLASGLRLIERVIELARSNKLPSGNGKNPFLEPVENFSELFPDFSKQIEDIARDRELFLVDLANTETFEAELSLQNSNIDSSCSLSDTAGNLLRAKELYNTCKVLAFRKQPQSKLARFWVRDEEEYSLLMTPSSLDPNKPGHFRRWRISVDPSQSEYNLRRLGYLLEKKETDVRGRALKREGNPRFESNYSDNEDPWYDGRTHNYTMVDSPRCGTELSFDQIKKIVTSRFHGIRLESGKEGNLVFYFFYEISDEKSSSSELALRLKEHGFTKHKPLNSLKASFKFVRDAELWQLNVFPEQEVFAAKVWASEITRHAILEMEVQDFYSEIAKSAPPPVILEDLDNRIEILHKRAQGLAGELKDGLPLKNEIWGDESYRLIKLCQPNLYFRNQERVRHVFQRMLDSELGMEQVEHLMSDKTDSEDIIRTSKALCVLGNESLSNRRDIRGYREICLLYALFLKTGYRNFSQRVGDIVDEMVTQNESSASNNKSRRRLRSLQEDYSVFLGRFEFSEGEINLNRKVQTFFRTALKEMAFEEQKNETRHEMRTTYDLAAAQERRMFEKQNQTLQKILIWVGVLAIGDFLYNWLITDNNQSLSKFEQGALLAFVLVMIAAFVSWIIEKKA
jgi:hypothetical protein